MVNVTIYSIHGSYGYDYIYIYNYIIWLAIRNSYWFAGFGNRVARPISTSLFSWHRTSKHGPFGASLGHLWWLSPDSCGTSPFKKSPSHHFDGFCMLQPSPMVAFMALAFPQRKKPEETNGNPIGSHGRCCQSNSSLSCSSAPWLDQIHLEMGQFPAMSTRIYRVSHQKGYIWTYQKWWDFC